MDIGSVAALARKLVILFVVIAAVVIVLGLGALFLLFVLLSSQRVSSHSCETLQELLLFYYCSSCYCFRARGIISVVCYVVPLKGIEPFMRDPARAAIVLLL